MAFKPRLTRPEAGNKYYITKANGGYSKAIKGSPTDKQCDVLSNCVGYAYGRFNEIGGYGSCKYLAPVNAENFMQYKGNLEIGQTPKLGACMVWKKGDTLKGSDGAGHVAIVEQIISDTEVVTSESAWGSASPFYTKTRKKGSNNRWGCGVGYTFLGFIYNPAVKEEAPKPTPKEEMHVVKKGDTLTSIAKKYKTTVAKLAKYNNIANPNVIRIGQKIKIPGTSATTPTAKVEDEVYVVKKHDTLSAIAKKYKTTVAKLAEYNNIANPNVIRIGQKIKIPR